ncbi:MAG: hypothetical protein M3292_07645 [Actinomycetota bacterium]|nr:hypothetical protein [Actinomycetota bacterium]
MATVERVAPAVAPVAHGGLGGLAIELLPALVIVALGLTLWLRSRKEENEP